MRYQRGLSRFNRSVGCTRPNVVDAVQGHCRAPINYVLRISGDRFMKSIRFVASIMFLLLALLPAANAQSVTGQIAGVVVDPAGAIVAGAAVELTHDLSQAVHR